MLERARLRAAIRSCGGVQGALGLLAGWRSAAALIKRFASRKAVPPARFQTPDFIPPRTIMYSYFIGRTILILLACKIR